VTYEIVFIFKIMVKLSVGSDRILGISRVLDEIELLNGMQNEAGSFLFISSIHKHNFGSFYSSKWFCQHGTYMIVRFLGSLIDIWCYKNELTVKFAQKVENCNKLDEY